MRLDLSSAAAGKSRGMLGSFAGAVVVAIVIVVLAAATASAQTRTWDQGNGDWNKTNTNWTGSTWADGNTAVFGGSAASTISLTEPISATGLTFNVNNNVVTGNTLTLTGTGAVAANSVTATINSTLAGTVGMTVEGGGTVNFGGDNSLRSSNSTTGLIIGQTSANNTVNVSNGGKFFGSIPNTQFRALTIGGSTFGGNVVNFSTPGTAASPTFLISGSSSQLNMGVSSSNNQINVTNGAYVYTQGGSGGTGTWTIGTNAGANGNSISVSGTSSVFRNALGAFLHVGNAGSSNSLTVSAGGTWHGARAPQMGAGGGDNNTVTFTGSNSLCYVSGGSNGWFQIGSDVASVGSTGNNYDVLAGAKFNLTGTGTSRAFSVGKTAGSDTNRLRISGTGSTANVNFALPIGVGVYATGTTAATLGGNSNVLDVLNGGALTTVTPIYVGSGTSIGAASASTNNVINLGNGTANAIATITVNASATQFNTAAGYDGVWTVPGTTTPISVQASSYTVPGSGPYTTQGIFLVDATSALNINNGRLVAGGASATGFVSGPGGVSLAGPAYFSIPFANQTATISSAISGSGSLTKEDTGGLILSGANTYSGDTTVVDGLLRLDSAFLSNTADVRLFTGTATLLNLNFIGSDTIRSLYIDNVPQPVGTYSASNLADWIDGTGSLVVTAVPEPGYLAVVAVGGLGAAMLARRRRKAA